MVNFNLKVYLDGTAGKSTWREELVGKLGETVDVFNYTKSAKSDENNVRQKNEDDVILYTVTPEENISKHLFEMGKLVGTMPEKTILCFLNGENGFVFNREQYDALSGIVKEVGDKIPVFYNLDELANFLNTIGKEHYDRARKDYQKMCEEAIPERCR